MSIARQIENILTEALNPVNLEVINESRLHAGHAGDDGSGESHFRIQVTADAFTGKSRIERHRMVYGLLQEKLPAMPHAVSVKANSPEE